MARKTRGRPADQAQPVFTALEAVGKAGATVREDIEQAVNDALTYLASPRGKELRERLSMGLIALAPVIARAPGMRRNPLFKILGVAGAAALLVKVAEAVRDWEPAPAKPS